MTCNISGSVTPQNYTYDQENRITGAAGFTYTYDADGNRVEKSNGATPPTGTLYWYMTPGIVGESDLAGNLKTEYVFFNGRRVARRDLPAGNISYYFSDRLGTASVVTDATGTILDESDYYPWGGELQFVNNLDNHYKFTGDERDGETGLDHTQFRQYASGMSRWLSPDPYGASMNFGNPQSLNRYSYVLNNPVMLTDPTGQWCVWEDGTHDDDPQNDGNETETSCQDKGGHWDPTDTITGLTQKNGIVTAIMTKDGTFAPDSSWATLEGVDDNFNAAGRLLDWASRIKSVNGCAAELSQYGSISHMSNGYIPEFLGSNTAGDIVGLATGTGSRSRQATGVATDAALHVGVELAADITVGVFGSQGIPITYKAAVTFAWLPVKLSQTAGGKALLGASKGALAGKMLLDAGVYIGALVDCAQQ